MEKNKLYLVTFQTNVIKPQYVVAKSTDEAWQKSDLLVSGESWGYSSDRALKSIEVIAEEGLYPACERILLL
jgi:hypothetical protein